MLGPDCLSIVRRGDWQNRSYCCNTGNRPKTGGLRGQSIPSQVAPQQSLTPVDPTVRGSIMNGPSAVWSAKHPVRSAYYSREIPTTWRCGCPKVFAKHPLVPHPETLPHRTGPYRAGKLKSIQVVSPGFFNSGAILGVKWITAGGVTFGPLSFWGSGFRAISQIRGSSNLCIWQIHRGLQFGSLL